MNLVHTTGVRLGNMQIVFHGESVTENKYWPLNLQKLVAPNVNPFLAEHECPKTSNIHPLKTPAFALDTPK